MTKINYGRVYAKNEACKWLKENGLYDEFVNAPEFLQARDYEYALSKGMPPVDYEAIQKQEQLDQDVWRLADNIEDVCRNSFQNGNVKKEDIKAFVEVVEEQLNELKNIIK